MPRPARTATSSTGRSVTSSRRRASRTRAAMTQRSGARPVSATNRRARVRGAHPACRARSATSAARRRRVLYPSSTENRTSDGSPPRPGGPETAPNKVPPHRGGHRLHGTPLRSSRSTAEPAPARARGVPGCPPPGRRRSVAAGGPSGPPVALVQGRSWSPRARTRFPPRRNRRSWHGAFACSRPSSGASAGPPPSSAATPRWSQALEKVDLLRGGRRARADLRRDGHRKELFAQAVYLLSRGCASRSSP